MAWKHEQLLNDLFSLSVAQHRQSVDVLAKAQLCQSLSTCEPSIAYERVLLELEAPEELEDGLAVDIDYLRNGLELFRAQH